MLATALITLLIGCPPKDGPGSDSNTAAVLSETTTDDGLTKQQVDINGDGTPDVYNYYRERSEAPRLRVRRESDLNFDGRIDMRTWFNDAGQIEKEEMDGDFDSQVDWVDHYQGGRRVMSEVDTDWNGVFDLFKYYEGKDLRRKERDTNSDGKVDYWEYFDDEGSVVKTGRDVDGDGVMDVREE